LAAEARHAGGLQGEGLDDPDAVDAFAQVLADGVIGSADRSIQSHQIGRLDHENGDAGSGQQQWNQAQQRVVPGEDPDGCESYQPRFEHLAPEVDQRIAHLVGVPGGSGHELTDAVASMVSEVESLNLSEDALP
jgi:hypothetical protein